MKICQGIPNLGKIGQKLLGTIREDLKCSVL